jgi:two-component system NtrC family sensor kinase
MVGVVTRVHSNQSNVRVRSRCPPTFARTARLPDAPAAYGFTAPPSRSLTAIADVARALANAETLGDVMPSVLTTLATELDGSQGSLWLRGVDGLRRAWSAGDDATSGAVVEQQLASTDVPMGDEVVVARLQAGRRDLGAISIRPGRLLTERDRLFFSTVADLLAPALRAAKYAHQLESEVETRTREIDAQRRFIEKIIDSLPVGLYVIDRSYRIRAWNRKRETGFQGVSRQEAIGKTIFEVLHRQPPDLLRTEFEGVFETGRIQQFSIESTTFGEPRIYRLTKIPMQLDDADVTHVITIGEDITEWRQAEDRFAQAEKLAAVGTLAAGVMHEINNPLAIIRACAENLVAEVGQGTINPATQGSALRESCGLIEQEVQRCKTIIEGLLDFSRPKSSEKTPVDVNAVIDRTLTIVKYHPRFRDVQVGFEAGSGLPAVVANEEQLVQVFMALLLNALDAMEDEGMVTLRTRLHESDHLVVAEVVDHGVGIRGSDRTKIFEPFYTTKGPTRGTGLGLSICYAIISEHGGRIEVDSVVGEGSVFRILLPAVLV